MRGELQERRARRYLPTGVADDQARFGYVRAANGGVDAIDLGTGTLRWHADGALAPVLGLDDALVAVALGEPPRLLLIDRGAVAATSSPLPWHPPQTSVEVVAASLDGSVVRLAWKAFEASLPGGIPRARSNVIDKWAAAVDLANGSVARLDFAAVAPPAPSQPGGGVPDQRGSDAAWICDDQVVALAAEAGRLVLRRWRDGVTLPPVELLPSLPPLHELRFVRTPDTRHIFIVDSRPDGKQRFRIWQSATGAALGAVAVEPSVEPWTVAAIGDRLYAVLSGNQNALHAYPIPGEAPLWSHAVEGRVAREVSADRR